MKTTENEIKSRQIERDEVQKEIERQAIVVWAIKDYIQPEGGIRYRENDPLELDELYKIDELKSNNEALTFEEKLQYVQDLDLQAKLVIENGRELLHVQCKPGINELLELCEGSKTQICPTKCVMVR